MRIFQCLIIVFALIWGALLHGQVVINEVHVKPAPNASGADIQSLKVCAQPTYGTEFIELYNTDPCIPADISCYILASSAFSGATNGSFRFPSGTTIPPQGHVSIGGPNAGTTFNLTNYCGDPHLLTGNDRWYLANGDMYLALYDDRGNPVNAVFWTSNDNEAGKWGTDSDLDEAPQYIPAGTSCPSVASLPMPNGVVEYAGGSPALGSSLSRTSDGATTWAELAPSVNNCNDGNCTSGGSFGVSATVNQPSCETADGSISLTPEVPGTYTYTWNPNVSSTSSANNLGGTTYQIHVSDGFCSWDTSITLPIPLPFSVQATVNQPLCFGATGDITINPSGSGPYSYSWSPNVSSTNAANNLSAGNYYIQIDDGKCHWDSTISISPPPEISFLTGSEPAPCPSINKGMAYVYNLSGGNGTLDVNWASPSSSNDTIFNLSAGSYAFEISDQNACKKTGTVNVGEETGPAITTNQTDFTICPDEPIEVIAAGADAYQINPGSEFNSGMQPNLFVSAEDTEGTFWMVGTDEFGCKDSSQFSISRFSAPTRIEINLQQTACSNGTGEIEIAQVIGGTAPYRYNLNGGEYGNSNTFTGLAAGNYNVGIQDANGCSFDTTAQITSASGPTAIFITTTNTNCNNKDGTLIIDSIHGGTSPYQYALNLGAFSGNLTYSSLDSGTYKVTVKDGNDCTFEVQSTVGINPSISGFSVSTQSEICERQNGSIKLESLAGGTAPYSFSIDGVTFQEDSTFQNLSEGNYTVSIKDDIGCSYDSAIHVNELIAPRVDIASFNHPTCFDSNDGDALGSVTGGTGSITYTWKDVTSSPIATTAQLSGVPHGTYKLVVSDANNCLDSSSITLNNPPKIALSIHTTSTGCTIDNGTARATATGGTGSYSYQWNTTPAQTTQTATGLGSSTPYTVTVTDENQCSHDTTIYISTLDGPQIRLIGTSAITCADSSNGSITTAISGGTKPYSLSWNTSPTQTDTVAKNLGAGTHTLTVSDNAHCNATFSFTLNAPPIISAALESFADTCSMGVGSIVANASGGTGMLNYLWNDPDTQTNATASNLIANSYTVVINDANGCAKSFSESVSNASGPNITDIALQNVHCADGTDGQISISASGNSTLTYQWQKWPIPSPVIGSSPTISGLDTGRYVVTVMDNSGCRTDSTIALSFNHPVPVFNLPTDTAFCQGDSIAIQNTATADSYLWYPTNETSQQIFARVGGEYRLEITRNGCSYEDTIHIREDLMPNLELGPDSTFCGAVMITLDITVNGNATYEWDGGSTSPVETFTSPNEYWATISRNRCITSDTIEFFSQDALQVILPNDTDVCDGATLNIVPQLINEQTPSYEWNTGSNAMEIAVSESGKYKLTVIDGVCTATDSIFVTFHEMPVVDLGNDLTLCDGDSVTLQSSYPQFNNQWQDGSFDDILTTSTQGFHWVEVQNLMCTDRDSIYITIQPLPQFNIGKDSTICEGDIISIGASVPNASRYEWNTGAVTPFIDVSRAGNYLLSVTAQECTATDTLDLGNYPLPEIPEVDIVKCYLDTLSIDITCKDCISYLWDNGDTTATIQVPHATVQEVLVSNLHGCQSTGTIVVMDDRGKECSPMFFVPNTFTPNGDGLNEIFKPITERPWLLDQYQLMIFNRWGTKIFESNPYEPGWNGVYLGNKVKNGVYNWLITYKLTDQAEIHRLTGKVSVLR